MGKIKNTITSIFMVPTLKLPKDTLTDNNFVNSFIDDVDRDVKYENAIYILFKPKDLVKFRKYLDNEYNRTKNILDDYDYEGGFVVVVYSVFKHFELDFKIVKQGKYSKTSKKFQDSFPKYITLHRKNGDIEEVTLQFRIFNKTQDLVTYWEDKLDVKFSPDQELWRDFNVEEETLDINRIRKELETHKIFIDE